MDKKDLVVKPANQSALAKTNNLLAITNKILTRQNKLSTAVDESWAYRLWEWADKNEIPDLTWVDDEDYKNGGYWFGLPRNIEKLRSLTELNISGICLNELSIEIGNLTNLIKLDVSNTNLTTLPSSIGNLKSLKELDIRCEELYGAPDDIFNLTNLEYLRIYEGTSRSGLTYMNWICNLLKNGCEVVIGTIVHDSEWESPLITYYRASQTGFQNFSIILGINVDGELIKIRYDKSVDKFVVNNANTIPVKKNNTIPTKKYKDEHNELLWQALRAKRKEIADDQDLPPYIIFHDATLKAMMECKPSTLEQMAQLSGMGQRKLDLYGEKFLSVIRDFFGDDANK